MSQRYIYLFLCFFRLSSPLSLIRGRRPRSNRVFASSTYRLMMCRPQPVIHFHMCACVYHTSMSPEAYVWLPVHPSRALTEGMTGGGRHQRQSESSPVAPLLLCTKSYRENSYSGPTALPPKEATADEGAWQYCLGNCPGSSVSRTHNVSQ